MLHASLPESQPTWRGGRTTPPGRVHLVEFGTVDLRPHFAGFEQAALAAKSLHVVQRAGPSHLLAWVLLPDRWHGLVEVAPGDSLARCVARYKFAMARDLRESDPARERIWSLDYYNRALEHDREVLDVAGRLVMHPIRAGLVRRLTDYPFWDAVWLPPIPAPPMSPAAPRATALAPKHADVAPPPAPYVFAHPAICF